MNVEVDHVEQKAVHSWSRISSAGQKALEDALRVFNPMSKDLTDTETQLVAFLQGLRDEGYQPTILRSKDVYGYSSCTADTPTQTEMGLKNNSNLTTTIPESSKNQSKGPSSAKVSSTSGSITINSCKVSSRPTSKSNSTNILLRSLKRTGSDATKTSTVGFPANMYPGVYPAVRLSVVLETLVPLKTTASSLDGKYKQRLIGVAPAELKLLTSSGSSRQTSVGKTTKMVSRPVEAKGCHYLIKKAPDSVSIVSRHLNGTLIKGPNGRILKESNACKASGILNGRIMGSSSQSSSGGTQSKISKGKAKIKPPVSKTQSKNNSHRKDLGQKRKRGEEVREIPPLKKRNGSIPIQKNSELNKKKLNLLKFRVIKVDRLSSDDEVRKKAQKIFQVNLSPVIKIGPLPSTVP
ncbi:coiled-coil domain-containing protein 71 [Microcaecilia unicolor]|uniref:Coiled-coil domain-containing protein 71 n=1 Tax=Microcaecilia unicolor TaxID=1415580 RepID=A0A6P7YER8_9AMPH|nr:coiled-coil domain-containing protein 71 [Microcaecilia unicolor]XP_030061579.1 coiled-coil domain-containing protein 71 [Microcaecilia unicolor]XP_030061580.1 coiled-coil domain-containing protein 71 [Microcaecilia unicolor]XP_030061581.1 coiled-coil domain-containing protein 71 [Microcaecilia unicolor]